MKWNSGTMCSGIIGLHLIFLVDMNLVHFNDMARRALFIFSCFAYFYKYLKSICLIWNYLCYILPVKLCCCSICYYVYLIDFRFPLMKLEWVWITLLCILQNYHPLQHIVTHRTGYGWRFSPFFSSCQAMQLSALLKFSLNGVVIKIITTSAVTRSISNIFFMILPSSFHSREYYFPMNWFISYCNIWAITIYYNCYCYINSQREADESMLLLLLRHSLGRYY